MLTRMDSKDKEQLANFVASRHQEISSDVLFKVSKILEDVRKQKDQACKAYTKQFDGIEMDTFKVSAEEVKEAIQSCDPEFIQALKKAKENIEFFHRAQLQQGYCLQKEDGVYLGQRVLPLQSIGIYVPGGRAQYPSSVLMNTIPAKIAGVRKIVMVTPPNPQGKIHPNIAAAAQIAGVDEIYKIGGAQAIAALAYGTRQIPRVDKIVGPGNIFVAAAKKLVFGTVDIDMIAGPSEILVIADEEANPSFVAADLLSQAEHDPMASAILVTTSESMLESVNEELAIQSVRLPKQEIVKASLRDYGKSVLCDSLEECVELSNAIAPEHLELMVKDPEKLLEKVTNAGSVFMGYYTCESIGDYFGGTNHVLPTSGTARFSSALGVDAFIKKSSFLHYSKKALCHFADQIEVMARQEDLEAHARAVSVRKEECR
ncbi:histidinol dehydrogenase [Faecalicoccus acidiformans]|uniref:Histidinol dehydrogenase n=1 Tax=Faecalicoccus acidiformans TaxID=915173 RepID=A0ABS2FQA1_9FIRM|nr:histidinol dehydrogenase [Faecalicoccus acidiformans]MBM6831964.1 histidinol dehydrogenase [Faecalicoccus acidiformans]MDM8203619.1 histidinol dehydrogenase [Faecalicoccus acidiformans]